MGDGEMWMLVPRWNLNGTWKGVTQESWWLNAGDTGPGWRWDANICTLMEVRWYKDRVYTSILGFGFLWDRTWMEVRCTSLKPGSDWDDAWIGVKCVLGGLGCHLEGGGRHVCEPGLRWDSTWKERKRESWSLNGVGMLIMRPGWGWNGTRMENYWG